MKYKVSWMWQVSIGVLLFVLTACGSDMAISDITVGRQTIDVAQGQAALITYQINAPATVSLWLSDTNGQRFPIREAIERQPSADAYQLTFNGSTQIDEATQRILPSGDYTLSLEALPLDGSAAVRQDFPFSIVNAPAEPFDVAGLAITPNPFSPDEDAIDDLTHFTYRLPVTSTVTIDVYDAEGTLYPFIAGEERGPGEHSEDWNGRPVIGGYLPPGDYTYKLTADDGRGNRVTKSGTVTIASAGIGKLEVMEIEIGPEKIERGGVVTMTVRVKNTGPVGLRTHGPASGYRYSSRQSYASIENEIYANKGGGLWRIGLDWEGNGGSGSRYPFRWAISPRPPAEWAEPNEFDILQPGEEAVITGSVEIKELESRMTFFVGVAHEGVDYPFDRLRQTLVEVDF